jgi:hypothetical protein
MALIALAADKGSPGVSTTALALAAVWPRPVLLAECDPSGGDLVYRFPAADGSPLDPRRGLLSLAVAARRGLQPGQLWEHTQKLHGGLDVLTGVINSEQGAGLNMLWRPVGEMLAALPQVDVIADCGRLGPDGPPYDLLTEATGVLLVTRPSTGDVVRLRDRAAAVAAAADKRGRRGFAAGVVVVADQRRLKAALGEIEHALAQSGVPAWMAGGLADDAKGAELLRGQWGGRLDKTLLIRSVRDVAQLLAGSFPAPPGNDPAGQAPGAGAQPAQGPPAAQGAPGPPQHAGPPPVQAAPEQQPPLGPAPQAGPAQQPPGSSQPVFHPRTGAGRHATGQRGG